VYVVVMGCGRVGSALSASLERLGHEVAVIDKDAQAFRRLGPDFRGRQVVGQGFHREVLIEAGAEKADAFAAVSSGDNSNILAARVAREKYGVEHIVARIYDPGRAEIYQRLGIPTVATVKWTSDQMLRRLLPQGHVPEFTDPSGKVVIAEMPVSAGWIGRRMSDIEAATNGRLAYLTRLGDGMVPGTETVYQEGDLLHIALKREDLAIAERVLDAPPPAH
jgi:trk system potassium uptake protein